MIKIYLAKKRCGPLPSDYLLLLKSIARKTLKYLGFQNSELSILLTNGEEIKKLNFQYRKIKKVTDVMAFPLESNENIVGDVVIAVDVARIQKRALGHSLKNELIYLLIHGILHLAGYRDDTKEEIKRMRAKEKELLSYFAIKVNPEP